jgi:hypothetical protein
MRDSVKTFLVALSLVGAACGSSGGGKNVAEFEGVWAPASGVFTETCAADNPPTTTTQVTNNVTWSPATTSDLVQTLPGLPTCLLHADISGSTATAVAGSMCTVTTAQSATSDAFTDVIGITSYSFVIMPDGKTASENFSGTDAETDNTTTQTGDCTFTQTASYTKQ